jgi:EmrB/QacA subfamily drug resistance transporter
MRFRPDSPRIRTSGRTRLTAVIVACALFMQNLDSTVIATALPTMAKAFGADPVHMNVALTSYLLSLAVFIPASGWVADRFGTRTVFRAAIAVFTIGSVLCGRADSLAFLVAARVLQGIGGAMMVPVGRLVLLRTAPKNELVAAMAWLTMPALLGPVLGPPVGGFIVTYFSWRWIFDINVPIGIIGIILVSMFVEDVREPPRGRFDAIGLLLCGIALSGLMFGLETAGRGVVPRDLTEAMVGVGLVAILGYLVHAWHHPAPLLDLSLMRLPCFGVALSAMMLFRTGIGAIPFLLPLMLQVGFGLSPFASGSLTFAAAAGAMAMKFTATAIIRRFGFRRVLIVNALISGLFLASYGLFTEMTPQWLILAALLVGGFFRSLEFTALNAIAFADIDQPKMSRATSFSSVAQQMSQTTGVAAGAAAIEAIQFFYGDEVLKARDFGAAFYVVALISVCSIAIFARLAANAGAEVSGRRTRPTESATAAAE